MPHGSVTTTQPYSILQMDAAQRENEKSVAVDFKSSISTGMSKIFNFFLRKQTNCSGAVVDDTSYVGKMLRSTKGHSDCHSPATHRHRSPSPQTPSFIVSISWSTDQTTTAQPGVPQTTVVKAAAPAVPCPHELDLQLATPSPLNPLPGHTVLLYRPTSRALSQLRQGLHQSGRMLGVLVWRSLHKGGFGQWFGVVWRSDWILGGGW
ncbi:hypothetical protein M0R45_036406 [Rubus argutus]|uniref:Uncharacterized protein n=1 Tax=Rubus argutus TaxID=59490 RepID=A0AAW1W042_RUBAR